MTGLAVQNLSVFYPNGTRAIANLSLDVAPGEIFGLVGPNGAGKSSLLKSLAGLVTPAGGRIVCGTQEVTGSAAEAAHFIGLMLDPLGVYNDLSAHQYLEFFARAYGIPAPRRKQRISEIVERLDLGPWLGHEVEILSAGWQRRLALGRMLISDAPILLLDEPAAGLDITARVALLEIVRALAAEGRTILVTSHILNELEQLADRFGILNAGSWVPVQDDRIFFSRKDLSSGSGARAWRLNVLDSDHASQQLAQAGIAATREGQAFRLILADEKAAAEMLQKIVSQGILVSSFVPEETGLSDFALKVLKQWSGGKPS